MDLTTTPLILVEAVAALTAALGTTLLLTLLLLIKSIADFTRAGPQIQAEVLAHFRLYSVWAVARLAFWAFLIASLLAGTGALAYACLLVVFEWEFAWYGVAASGALALGLLTALQFCRHVLYIPSSIIASFHYRFSRLYPLWRLLSPKRLLAAQSVLFAAGLLLFGASLWKLAEGGEWARLTVLAATAAMLALAATWAAWTPQPKPRRAGTRKTRRPNVLLIGADTLRVDRLGAMGYPRTLTPCIDGLVERGALFANCYVPLARTAPSFASLLTGSWPYRHGLRDNYVADQDTKLPVESLPRLLSRQGYRTVALADWAGGDLGKIDFGFGHVDAPPDQWNFKYYLRQGPMDLRLFLSLFTHNRFGKTFLPEIYYLAGVPLTSHLGNSACRAISDCAKRGEPFLLTLFAATAHAPFGSEYPYHTLFSDRDYDGESKFVMTGLTDPREIIEKQGAPSSAFDIGQIINLYDACVRRFDDEVARITKYLHDCGLADDTILVIFSDHGNEFFEHGTWGQGNTVLGSDPGARVPLVIVDPRRPGTGVVTKVTRSVDLMPTLLELLDLPVPPSADGASLVPHLDHAQADLDLAAYQETGIWLGKIPGMDPEHITYPDLLELIEIRDKTTGTLSIKKEYEDLIIEAKDRMIRTDRWKLVYQPMRRCAKFMLFDVLKDPECRHDISTEHPQVLQQLKEKLISWMTEEGRRDWMGEHIVPGKTTGALWEPSQSWCSRHTPS